MRARDDTSRLGRRAAGVLFLLSALLSIARMTVLRPWLPTEAGPAEVYTGAVISVMLGVALLQGSELARKFVLVVTALGGLALMAVLTIAVAQLSLKQALLLWLGAAIVIVIPILALLGLLLGESPSRLRVGICCGVLAIYTVGAFAIEILVWRTVEGQVRSELALWAAPERTFKDAGLGLAIDPPGDWTVLRKDCPLVSGQVAIVTLGHGSSTALAVLKMEELRQEGPGSPNAYLDRIRQNQADLDDYREVSRERAMIGGAEAHRLTATWRQKQRRYRGWVLAWQDGWRYFTLSVWAPEARASVAEPGLTALERSIAFTPVITRQLGELLTGVSAIAPHLSAAAVKALLAKYPGHTLSAADLFRLGHRWSVKGLEHLAPPEVKELGEITRALFSAIPVRERTRLGAYLEKVRFDGRTTTEEDVEMARLMKTGTDTLPQDSLIRLQALLEKGISLAILMDHPLR